jgi:photosynthetic reaction center cytochrome c subunit
MRNRINRRAMKVAALTFAAALFIAGRADEGARGQEQGKTAEQVYKNIQTLNGMLAAEMDGVMNFMSASLGVNCDYCHTERWESDDKPAKLITRKMIEMTRRINKENFSSNNVVNCFTCHRGQTQTVTVPPFARTARPVESNALETKPVGALPSTDEIVNKYTRAIGGEAAIEKLKTILWRGRQGDGVDIEVYQAAPNKRLVITKHPGGAVYEGFDGATAWTKSNRGLETREGKDLIRQRQAADFFWFLKLKESYPAMRVLGKENVDGRDTVVVGATSKYDSRERLYFDSQTGLLLRRYVVSRTAFGSLPEVTDFSDYREVSGVRLPFTINYSLPPFYATWKLGEARANVSIDDSKFRPPSGN